MNHTIIPAAACLTFLTAGSLSIYGNFDLILPSIIAISIVCILYLVFMMVLHKRNILET
jgi:hypothetical protein